MAGVGVSFFNMFHKKKSNIIGMIHLWPTPVSPKYRGSIRDIVKKAEYEANLYKAAGVDSVLVENMHDVPYLHSRDVGPEVVSVMTIACSRVRKVFGSQPVGVQVLAAANTQALAIALAAELDYIRAEGFVYGHVADEGWMNACAGPLLRYRHQIGGEHIQIYTDIKKKHCAHSVTSDVSIADTAKAAQYFLSDAVIVTGSSTSVPVDLTDFQDVQNAVNIPVVIGSGVTAANYHDYQSANAIIIGSYFKCKHHWANDIDEKVLGDFMDMVRKLIDVKK